VLVFVDAATRRDPEVAIGPLAGGIFGVSTGVEVQSGSVPGEGWRGRPRFTGGDQGSVVFARVETQMSFAPMPLVARPPGRLEVRKNSNPSRRIAERVSSNLVLGSVTPQGRRPSRRCRLPGGQPGARALCTREPVPSSSDQQKGERTDKSGSVDSAPSFSRSQTG